MILDKHHPVYMAWCNMKTRCNNSKSTQWEWYGGRGIHYCSAWEKFENFYNDLMPTWDWGLTLDRKDNNGNYTKENCRWITQKDQNWNRRSRRENTSCMRGHPFTDDNIIVQSDGNRTCKICRKMYIDNNRDRINLNRKLRRQGKDSVKFNDIKENS